MDDNAKQSMNVFRIFNVLYVLSDIYILFRGLVL